MTEIAQLGIHSSVGELFPPRVLREALEGVEPAVQVQIVESTADLDSALSAVDGVVTFDYDEAFLTADLAWIHSIQAGVDRFPAAELAEREIRLTSSSGIHGDSVGETVAGYLLMFARRLHIHRTNQTQHEWMYPAWDAAFTLDGESVCVVGLGTLGKGIARRADALGMHVTGVKRTPTPVEHVATVHSSIDLHDALTDARFVALTVPLTERTTGLIGEAELEAMRDDAYLINVSRGEVVDQSELIAALDSDALAGAALDVFETEPLPTESSLWDRENVLVTPHAAAANHEYYRRVARLVQENLRRIEHDEPLANRVV